MITNNKHNRLTVSSSNRDDPMEDDGSEDEDVEEDEDGLYEDNDNHEDEGLDDMLDQVVNLLLNFASRMYSLYRVLVYVCILS